MNSRNRFWPILLIGFLAICFLSPVLFTDRVLLPGRFLQQLQPFAGMLPAQKTAPKWNVLQWDDLAQYYPWRLFAQRSIRNNEIPLWNPHQFCGTPFVANGQSAVFYPPNVLFWVLPVDIAFEWSAALHIFLAGVFMFGLAREMVLSKTAALVSAISFMFCGFIVTWLELPTLVNAAVWIPAAFWLVERVLRFPGTRRRDAVLLSLCVGVQLLAGHFQISLYLLLAIFLRVLWENGAATLNRDRSSRRQQWRGIAALSIGTALGILVAAIQVLPTAELARCNHRSAERSIEAYQWYLSNAMSPLQLGRLFVPDLFGNPGKDIYWGPGFATAGQAAYTEYCGYIGFLPLLLALASLPFLRRARAGFYALLSGLSLLVALGTPVTYPLYFLVPGFSQMGGLSRILILFCFAAALMAGVGWEYGWRQADISPKKIIISCLPLGVGAVLASELCALVAASAFSESPPLPLLWVPLLSLLIWSVIGGTRAFNTPPPSLFRAATLAWITADLFVFAHGFNPTAPRRTIYPSLPLDALSHGKRSRCLTLSKDWSLFRFPRATLPPNAMTVYRQYDVQGYDSLQSKYYKNLMARLENSGPSPPENGNMILLHNYRSPIVSLLGVRRILSPEPLEGEQLRLLADSPLYMYENLDAWPAAFVVDRLPDIEGLQGAARPMPCDMHSYGAQTVSVIPRQSGKYLALTDSFSPGWHAYAGSAPLATFVWADALRAAELPSQTPIRVDWVYLPNSFRAGAFLSFLTILGLTGFLSSSLQVRRR